MIEALQEVLEVARTHVEALRSLITSDYSIPRELHISLSPAIMLKDEQRTDLTKCLKAVQAHAFEIAFTDFAVLKNDEGTRRFLAIRLSQESSAIVKYLQHQIERCLESLQLPTLPPVCSLISARELS